MSSIKFIVFFVNLLICLIAQLGHALDNGLARRPPMGWLAWERFTCTTNCTESPYDCISERLFRTMADRLLLDGYRAVGYDYINIDDCWSEMLRDNTTQRLVPNKERFPNGLQNLASYVHAKDLKLGLYGDCGTHTCAGYPGQLKSETDLHADNYFELDAQSLVDWQVDSFKFDGCNIDPLKAESICPKMSLALNTSTSNSRSILLICEWPFYMLRQSVEPDFALAAKSCNTWRYYEDVEDAWLSILNIVDFSIKLQDTIVKYHGPGQWFDPDQLVIGNFGLSLDQAKAQMALWCIWSAPLYMSNDLRSISAPMAAVLKNEHLIAVDQDELGVFGLMVTQADEGNLQAFVKPVKPIRNGCPSFVIAYLNRNILGNRRMVSFKLRDLITRAPIQVAAQRYREMNRNEFNPDQCLKRLKHSMTREPLPTELLVKPSGKEGSKSLEETSIEYDVIDLFQHKRLPKVELNSSLELNVNPSSVTIVKLIELNKNQ